MTTELQNRSLPSLLQRAHVLALLLFLLGFLLWWPDVVTNTDEGMYVTHAMTLQAGHRTVPLVNALTRQVTQGVPSGYPVLTAVSQLPGIVLARLAGVTDFWRGAYLSVLLAVFLTILSTRVLLQRLGLNPFWALIWLVFPPFIVMSRLATSDVLAAGWCALTLAVFAHGLTLDPQKRPRIWLLAGFLAGASLCLREMAPLVPLVFFAGAFFRREKAWHWLLIGGLLGVALRPITSALSWHNPFFVKPHGGSFNFTNFRANFLADCAILTFLLPAGLPALLLYRGPRRPEVLVSGVVFTLVHISYLFAVGTGGFFAIVIGGRFFLLAVPVYIVAIAHAAERLQPRMRPRTWLALQSLLAAGALVAAFAIHPVLHQWSRLHRDIRDRLCATVPPNVTLMTNLAVTGKYLLDFSCPRPNIDLNADTLKYFEQLKSHGPIYVAIADRQDSTFWTQMGAEGQRAFARLEQLSHPQLLYRGPPDWQSLTVWKLDP